MISVHCSACSGVWLQTLISVRDNVLECINIIIEHHKIHQVCRFYSLQNIHLYLFLIFSVSYSQKFLKRKVT